MFNWNNLRFFLAIAKEGGTLAAARALCVNQSTVQRRLADLETQLGQRLVERLPTGYRLMELARPFCPMRKVWPHQMRSSRRPCAVWAAPMSGLFA